MYKRMMLTVSFFNVYPHCRVKRTFFNFPPDLVSCWLKYLKLNDETFFRKKVSNKVLDKDS